MNDDKLLCTVYYPYNFDLDVTVGIKTLYSEAILPEIDENILIPTIQKYERCKGHQKSFIKKYYGSEDMKFSHLDLQFIENFEVYLKTDGKCCHNTSMKHIQILNI